jgi:type IV secretion system protein VirD4
MSATARMPTMPRTIGERPAHPLAVLALLVGLVLTSWTATEIIAYRLGFSPSLGTPLIGTMYQPLAWLHWLWMACNPFTGVNPLTHRARYVPAVYDALRTIPWTMGTGVIASLLAYIRITHVLVRKDDADEKVSQIVDSSHFATLEEIGHQSNFLTADCGPIIGMIQTRPDVWEYLRWDGDVGMNIVGTQGVGKTSDYIKTNLLIPLMHPQAPTWSDADRRAHPYGYEPNLVVLDIKGDLTKSTSGYQRDGLKKNVFVFSPFSTDLTHARYGTFHLIRLGTDHEFDDCYRAGLDIVDEGQGLKTYWDKTALDFGGAIVATIGYMALAEKNPRMFSHPGLIDYISRFKTPDALITDMLEREHDPHGVLGWTDADGKPTRKRAWIIAAATAMNARAAEEKSGIFGSFIQYIGMYRSAIMRRHIMECTFDVKRLANDPDRASTIYIQMPDADLEQIRGYVRIMTKTMFRELMSHTITVDGRELPSNLRLTKFVLDEVRALNKLEPLATSSGYMRGHKVQLDTAWQGRNQIEECYGKSETITGNLGAHMYYRTQPGGDSEWLSARCGKTSFVVTERNISGKRITIGPRDHLAEANRVQTRENLTEFEARNLPPDEKILFARGLQMRVKQVRYYENEMLRRRSKMAAVDASAVTVKRPFFLEHLENAIGKDRLATLMSAPPDRWAQERESAEPLKNGCRVRRWDTVRKDDGARIHFAQLWLPNALTPILNAEFPTLAEREMAIKLALSTFEQRPAAAEMPEAVEPHANPRDSFHAAVEARAARA